MSDLPVEKYTSIDEGIKSIPVDQLEKFIASAISSAINYPKLDCHITKLDISRMYGVKIDLQLSDDLGDSPFFGKS